MGVEYELGSYSFHVERFEVFRIDGAARTPSGSIRANARLTRTGVFAYTTADGGTRKELRHPEEIFQADSLATLRGLPLTIGHPGKVTPKNWKAVSVGHVGDDVRQDGKFVAATLYIEDGQTCDAVEAGTLVELSCGYDVTLKPEAGEFEGERYDMRQVAPVYNHVALLASGRGRAGKEVRLRLDAADNAIVFDDMDLQKELDTVRAERDSLKVANDKLSARADSLEAQVNRIPEIVRESVSLREDARTVLGAEDFTKVSPKSDREVMLTVITKLDSTFRADGKSEDYLRARFDSDVSRASKESIAGVNRAAVTATHQDAGEDNEAEKARKESAARVRKGEA